MQLEWQIAGGLCAGELVQAIKTCPERIYSPIKDTIRGIVRRGNRVKGKN